MGLWNYIVGEIGYIFGEKYDSQSVCSKCSHYKQKDTWLKKDHQMCIHPKNNANRNKTDEPNWIHMTCCDCRCETNACGPSGKWFE